MKIKFLIIILPLFIVFLCGAAAEEDLITSQVEKLNEKELFSRLSEDTEEILGIIGMDDVTAEKILSLSFNDVLLLFSESVKKSLTAPLKAVFSVIAASIICCVVNNFCENFSETGHVINAVSALAVSSAVLVPVKDVFTSSARVICECSDFMLGFIPLYSSAIAASGNLSSAAGYRTLMMGASSLISRLSSETVLPLISIFLAMCIAGTVSDINIGEIAKSVKSFAVWILTVSMTVFSGILGLGTLISSSADSSVSKTAKFIIGSAIPVVGGSVTDALVSLKSCLSVTKNIFGIYGILVTAAVFLPVIFTVLSWKVCISAAASISKISENKSLYGLLSAASAALGIILALLVTTSMMFIFSVSILMMTGGGI